VEASLRTRCKVLVSGDESYGTKLELVWKPPVDLLTASRPNISIIEAVSMANILPR
jgi:hypothetical protein